MWRWQGERRMDLWLEIQLLNSSCRVCLSGNEKFCWSIPGGKHVAKEYTVLLPQVQKNSECTYFPLETIHSIKTSSLALSRENGKMNEIQILALEFLTISRRNWHVSTIIAEYSKDSTRDTCKMVQEQKERMTKSLCPEDKVTSEQVLNSSWLTGRWKAVNKSWE